MGSLWRFPKNGGTRKWMVQKGKSRMRTGATPRKPPKNGGGSIIGSPYEFREKEVIWLVVYIPTPLKNDGVRQLWWLFPIYGKIKNVPNHQPVKFEVPQSTNMWGSSRRTWLATLAQHIPWGYHVNGVSTKETSEATKKIKLRSSLLCETVCKVRVP
jgi:hypothetical protein